MKKQSLQQNTILPKRIILHPYLDVVIITDVKDNPKTFCNRIQAKQIIQRHPICLTDVDYDYIWYEIDHWDKIESEINVSGNGDKE